MNLDGPGYALSLLLIGEIQEKYNFGTKAFVDSGEILILAMAFFWGGLGFGGRSFSYPQVQHKHKML